MGNPAVRPGEQRFREAVRNLRARSRPAPAPPLNLSPTTPFEHAILSQYDELRRDFDDLKKRVDWLTLAIVGAALTLVLERIFTNPP